MSNLFSSGIPTRMDVDRLLAEFKPEPGSTITHAEIGTVLGLDVDSNRFDSVTSAWRKRLFRERNLQSASEGRIFLFLTADQAFDQSERKIHYIGRATGRLGARVGSIDTRQLTGERRDKHQLLSREVAAMADAARHAAKELAGPKPVATPPRLNLAQNTKAKKE